MLNRYKVSERREMLVRALLTAAEDYQDRLDAIQILETRVVQAKSPCGCAEPDVIADRPLHTCRRCNRVVPE